MRLLVCMESSDKLPIFPPLSLTHESRFVVLAPDASGASLETLGEHARHVLLPAGFFSCAVENSAFGLLSWHFLHSGMKLFILASVLPQHLKRKIGHSRDVAF
jgi:hypothetical protein